MAENSERHSMTTTYIHKFNLGVNMSYNMRHALNTMFCLLSVSFVPIHTTVMLTVCYINRQPGRGYHYSETNAPQAITTHYLMHSKVLLNLKFKFSRKCQKKRVYMLEES